MTLGTLSISLLPWVQAEGDSSSSGQLPKNPSMFSSGGLYYLMGALICSNILQRINPYLGRCRAIWALADTSLWGSPALIIWSGYNWVFITSQVKQFVLGSLRSIVTLFSCWVGLLIFLKKNKKSAREYKILYYLFYNLISYIF